jgi:DNA polymerase-3 subunit beta
MKVNREAMIASIRRVALYASQTTHQVRFQIEKDSLQIMAQDIDFGGEAKETIPCGYNSDPLEIGFNSQYLVDILTHLENQDVLMKFSTSTRAGIISPDDDEGHDDVVMLVMPVRLTT